MEIDPALVIPNRALSIDEGAIAPWSRAAATNTWYMRMLQAVAKKHGFKLDVPVSQMKQKHLEHHPVRRQRRRSRSSTSTSGGHTNKLGHDVRGRDHEPAAALQGDGLRLHPRRDRASTWRRCPCPTCNGARLKPETLAVTVAGKNIAAVTSMDVREARDWIGAAGGRRRRR